MSQEFRSNCPLNYALELFGDKWSLLIIRDMMLFNKRYFNEFLKSKEGISTNILRDRLNTLETNGFIVREPDQTHKQKIKHSLTKRGIDLLPVIIEILFWSEKQTDDLHPDRHRLFELIKEDKERGMVKMRQKIERLHLRETS